MPQSRRTFLAASAMTAAGLASRRLTPAAAQPAAAVTTPADVTRPGRLKQSVTRWTYGGMPYDDFCQMLVKLGFEGVDLVNPADWATVKKHGLQISTSNSTTRGDFISRGLNNRANHELILGELEAVLPAAAKEGIPNVIAMFGNAGTISTEDGIAACAELFG